MDLDKEVVKFVDEVDKFRKAYYKKHYENLKCPNLTISEGTVFYKLVCDNSVWGFISKVNKIHKGAPIKVGDLLMAAGWSSPAKNSRGSILDGTAKYGAFGPEYLK